MKTLGYLAAAAFMAMAIGCASAPSGDAGLQAYSPDEPTPAAAASPAPAPVAAARPAAPTPAATAPAAPAAANLAAGKAILETKCAACHAPDVVAGSRRTRSEWEEVIDQMIGRGASIDDAEHATLAAYLAATYGR